MEIVCFILPESDAARKRMGEIVLLANTGHSIKEIANDLFLSPRTVVHHLRAAISTMTPAQTKAVRALLDALDEGVTK